MPTYTFRLPAAFSSTAVTVYNTADVQQTTGTTDANATFSTSLPTGDYYARVTYGYTSYRAAGEVDRGDLDNVSEATMRGELAYAESTTGAPATTVNAFGGTPDPIPGLSVTFTLTQTTRVNIEFTCPSARNNTANFGVGALVMSGSTEVARAFVKDGTASMDMSLYVKRRLTLAPGTYTYTANYGYYGGGSASINAGATFPMVLQVTQV